MRHHHSCDFTEEESGEEKSTKEIIKEVIGISATIALGIIVMFGFMLVLPD